MSMGVRFPPGSGPIDGRPRDESPPPAEPAMTDIQLPAFESDYGELLRIAVLAAEAGGRELMAWRGKFKTREKSPADLVTDADLASQRAISEAIERHSAGTSLADYGFLGEENPGAVRELLGQPVCWVVDPLDGTTNYVHDFPAYSVSVAATVEGEPAVGVIYDPLHGRMFAAATGGGAWLDGERLRVSDTGQLADSLVAISLPPQAGRDSPDVLDFVAAVPRCRAVRRIGSAALNLGYVAAGSLDAHWARAIHPWDVAAGVVLVREAGGLVSASTGGPFDLAAPHFVASTPGIHAELLELLRASGAQPAV